MARKKKEVGIIEPTKDFIIGSSILGVGGSVIAGVPGATAAKAGEGILAASSLLPTMGVALGGGLVIGQLRNLEKSTKRKRRK